MPSFVISLPAQADTLRIAQNDAAARRYWESIPEGIELRYVPGAPTRLTRDGGGYVFVNPPWPEHQKAIREAGQVENVAVISQFDLLESRFDPSRLAPDHCPERIDVTFNSRPRAKVERRSKIETKSASKRASRKSRPEG